MDAWENKMLVEDTVQTCKQYLDQARGEDTEEKRERTYTSLILLHYDLVRYNITYVQWY